MSIRDRLADCVAGAIALGRIALRLGSPLLRLSIPTLLVLALNGCDGAPSRNILGSYFPSWMVCALAGIALALGARALFNMTGVLEEIPLPFVVMLAMACAATFALWLVWLS